MAHIEAASELGPDDAVLQELRRMTLRRIAELESLAAEGTGSAVQGLEA
jgi:hypothetical protein